jgi:hypothetical protein
MQGYLALPRRRLGHRRSLVIMLVTALLHALVCSVEPASGRAG